MPCAFTNGGKCRPNNDGRRCFRRIVDENKNETMKDRKLKVCIVTAQTRWRSKFEIELLGI
ncbi:hypothetical protein E8M60_13730 [Neisseria gonorrhoeae]|nr:hypothetical protein EGH16_05585 [Neisseria gonorrhoeae]TJX21274.1 hypothetical protein E8M60_13730 [Neisseria gonorrhoeae]